MREDGDLAIAQGYLMRHRALEDTVERARHYGAMAKDALELFPNSDWKHALLDVVDFCVARGVVTSNERDGDKLRVHCDVWIENQKKDKVIVGTASALIPITD